MADPHNQEQDGFNFARLAVQHDQQGDYKTAVFYYSEATQALLCASMAGSTIPNIVEKANEYILRAETLKEIIRNAASKDTVLKSQDQCDLERANFLVSQALDEDESGNSEEAADLYMEAAELCLKINTEDVDLKNKVKHLALQAIERAEAIKKKAKKKSPPAPEIKPMPPLGYGAFLDDDDAKKRTIGAASLSNTPPSPTKRVTGSGSYTKEEIQVLRTTSFINGREYVPFMSVDIREKFAYPVPFTDKDGALALSQKQKQHFGRWVRPSDIIDNPAMIYAVSSFSVKQTIVSDCSFVASLSISAQYERRFKKKLITSIIYPQNRNGDPQYNPCGKYMVKLNINGVNRKVIIDDYLPVDKYGDLLCSFSNNKNELWVALMEKAYMKVMGGYQFPGSNSNNDLHALTGWIPERVSVKKGPDDFNPDKEFKKIMDRFHKGHCLVTVATGDIPKADADRAGLVPTHAYAMLDIREVKGKKLMMLKNPWSHQRWRGNFSEIDTANWTPELQKLLNYDPKSAQMMDNGVFWIDYASLLHFYEVIYINWDPDLFSHTTCFHHTWASRSGPKKDSYNISDNPQYRLEVKANQAAPVWILLSRHITDIEDFADNKEFITVLVYKTGGKKIYYPYDPPPYRDGVRINSPHYLCKMVQDKGTMQYTLVISQYEKNSTIHYTLRVYSTAEFSLTKINDPYVAKYEKQVTGHWKGQSAGGCSNNPTHKNNPIYQVKIDNTNLDNSILIELRGPKEYSVGFDVRAVTENNPGASGSFTKISSGDFRRGFCYLELFNISGGLYNIQPSTFHAGKEGPFFLNVSSSTPITLSQIQ